MAFSAADIAAWCAGRVEGPDQSFTGMASLETAAAGTVAFAGHPRYSRQIDESQAAGCICTEGLPVQRRDDQTIIWVANADLAVAQVLEHLQPRLELPPVGVHPSAVVDPTAELGEGVRVGPQVIIAAGAKIGARTALLAQDYVGANSTVGPDCLLYPQVTIRERCTVGARVILHPGCVIGADGFGYRFADGRHVKIPHVGTVEIGDDCELGANTTVDRGKFAATVVGAGSKLDNLVQIGHNVRLGRHSILVAHTALGGSVTTGDYLVMGGASVVSDHVRLGTQVQVAGMSAVTGDVPDRQRMGGTPAQPLKEFLAHLRAQHQLPRLLETVQELKARIAKLESGAEEHRD